MEVVQEKFKMEKEETEFKYLIKDIGYDSFKQAGHTGCYSGNIGRGIHDKLPHYISEEGDSETKVIRSDNPEFNEILIEDSSRLEKLIEGDEIELKKLKKNIYLINLNWDTKSTKYLIRSKKEYSHYLQTETLGTYSRDIGTAIHNKIPEYILKINNTIISSDNPEFNKIIRKYYHGTDRQRGAEGSLNHYKWRLEEDKESFNKIAETLGSKLRKN